jgi:glycosyltransferase involved in cell wall biosynthesis
MRILHILSDIRNLGNGTINVAVDLACIQSKHSHTVAVASAGGEYEELLSQYGVRHLELDQTIKLTNILRAMLRYRVIVQEFQPDIVHAHMEEGTILASFLRIGTSYRLISSIHYEFLRTPIIMGLADRVIAVSKAVAQSMQKRGIPQEKLRVVQNGPLGSPRTRKLSEYTPLPLHRPAITTVAGMYHRKGIAELIAAFAQIAPDFPEAHLYLVGDGPDRVEFEEQSRSTSVVDRIHFEKFQPEPQGYLLSTDIFVLASHRDPSPLVIPEARAAGCAIVANNVDGIPEALDQGQAGYLVPSKSISTLSQTLYELLSEHDVLSTWKDRSKQNLHWLNIERVHTQTLEIYSESLCKL